MGGGGPESTSTTSPVVIYPKTRDFQESIYPGMFGQLWQRGLEGDEKDRIYAETLGRNQAMQGAAGATQQLTNSLANQGVSTKSPLYASLNRGIQTNLASNLLGATEQAARAKQAGKAGYMELLSRYASAYPPVGSTSTSQSSGGGGGK